ncbi:heat shock protein HslVU, ATPase subunit, HslU putative [Trypanosoma brucei gambiense DAL972]|uniref:Heat shock protein HslVU, ATPase subunit, HslU putative n=1 Tax=Trypanosoma brucei gambiense (strain MHOM/CI/86/DAL972) TaxID=679716 RepID=D0A997_TRYB9|nr:heat shock protein HslVU, ATPase subunit, HslU putative [Trypanosoma brucei gambiense DAL972]CBH18248.1 heat shock protein HslVU, ATPase subunit, HslU putative [Trypanosoma brucei gambiense DAL972]|eukprot:XP_011780512.1 heat shock protein HslVU, ATPase subunit, HslU putative [Trypanosoma brucei gambiense DAL972]
MIRFSWVRLCSSAVAAAAASPDVQAITRAQAMQLDDLSPRKIASILDSYIVGQAEGKRAVAISLRNRWRRRQIEDEGLRRDILPKNILLVGPTGVGKTEISRRMAKLTEAPFVKVEATKYTEVGFKGKDVESIIEDLYSNAKTKAKRRLEIEREKEAHELALEIVFNGWHSCRSASGSFGPSTRNSGSGDSSAEEDKNSSSRDNVTFEEFKEKYKTQFKDDMVVIDVTQQPKGNTKPNASINSVEMLSVGILLGLGSESRGVKTRVTKRVEEALPLATQEALSRLVDETQISALARTLAEQDGVVFIDEIDKVVTEPASANADVSSTGVQQDLLPLIEGSNVTLKDGSQISTDNILFICSGAFHTVKTSDMIAELQGRLPVRVEMHALKEEDIRRILCEPKFNLLLQQKALMKTENIDLEFTPDAVDELARVTTKVNANAQNIGARRLHTVVERVMDEYSFNCQDYEGKKVVIDAEVVRKATGSLMNNIDLAKYIL